MEKYAVIGWPIKHSLSPQMQLAGFHALGIAADYEKLAVPPDQLADAVNKMRRRYKGWNVTVPHKQTIIPLLDTVEPTAAKIGSVNTIINRDGLLHGCSTDGWGLMTALKESFEIDLAGHSFAFIGAGGAARATAPYFAANGAASITVINRTLTKAQAICQLARNLAPYCKTGSCTPGDVNQVRALLQTADVIIQATSLGLNPDDPLPLDIQLLPTGKPVYEMIYRPTPFLRAAQARNCPSADGAGMLLHQGAKSLELWTGQQAPVNAMRAALHSAMKDAFVAIQ